MSLPLTYLDPPQRLYATEEIDETIQLAASDFHQDRYDDCVQKCQGLLTHFRDIPFYFQLSIHTLLGSAYQDSASVQRSYNTAQAIFSKVRAEHPIGKNPSLDAFLHSIEHMLDYVADWQKGLEAEEQKWTENGHNDEKRQAAGLDDGGGGSGSSSSKTRN